MRALKVYWKSAGLREALRWARFVSPIVACACAGSSSVRDAGPPAAVIAASRVQSQTDPTRPRLILVEREGDPERGLAVAVHTGTDARAAIALALLVEDRLRASGMARVASHPSPSGFIVHSLAASQERIGHFITAANRALLAPPSVDEVSRVSARVRTVPLRTAASESEAALARCSGELVLPEGVEAGRLDTMQVGAWLREVSSGDVAFAVVGTSEDLMTARGALQHLGPWTRAGTRSVVSGAGEAFGVTRGMAGVLHLSVATWGLSAVHALAGAERLGEPESLLAIRLGAAFPSWQVTRVASNLDGAGACLRVDLQSNGGAPTLEAVARSAAHALSEIEQTVAGIEPSSWVLAKQVLSMDGPHQAAAVAAWQALYAAVDTTDSIRRIVHFAGELAVPAPPDALAELLAQPVETAARVELQSSVEPGQGQFWMLLGTPCGTTNEDATTAGTLALAMHASALAFNGRAGVTLEPWLSVDAIGLIAHAPAIGPGESPAAQAQRVAEALARAILTSGPPPEIVSQAREGLMTGLAEAPTLSLALRQSSANRPSWLEPRGTWASLSAISARSVQLERESFLRGKLRLAILGNQNEAQVQLGERRLLGLLAISDAGRGECPAPSPVTPLAGRYRIESAGTTDTEAVLSVPLPAGAAGLAEEALWTEYLMNRAGGWLEQSLQLPGLVSTARARVFGGGAAAALIIELRAVDGKRDDAVAQIRGLMSRLRAGAATASDVAAAREHFRRRSAERQLDPRGRLIDLWMARPRATATLESLRALHRVAFEAGREVVILADPSE